jgi:hypothetical protein|nr:MAG TPA: GDSL-like Lipase/Acylhydrolase [Caudoviricetes sp.]
MMSCNNNNRGLTPLARKNYNEDFFVRLRLLTDGEGKPFPDGDFMVVFTSTGGGRYTCGRENGALTNCKVNPDGTATCFIQGGNLEVGTLKAEVRIMQDDPNFPSGKRRDVLFPDGVIELVTGASSFDDVQMEVAMNYAVVSAYELAVKRGYQGTQEEFYATFSELTKTMNSTKETAKGLQTKLEEVNREWQELNTSITDKLSTIKDGKSAYELAKEHGYVGTAEDFYSSFRNISKVVDSANSIKESIKELKNELNGKNKITKEYNETTKGSYILPNGNTSPHVAFATSDYIDLPSGSTLTTSNLFGQGICFYDVNKQPTTKQPQNATSREIGADEIPADAMYFRFAGKVEANPNVTIKYTQNAVEMLGLKRDVLTVKNTMGGAKRSVYADGLYKGFLSSNGTFTGRAGWLTSDYIVLPNNATITSSGLYGPGICFYDAHKKPTAIQVNRAANRRISYTEIPANAMYFRFTYATTSTPSVEVEYSGIDEYKADVNKRISILANNPGNEVATITHYPIYDNTYILPDGTNGQSNAYMCSEFIEIPEKSEVRTYNLYNIAFYDANLKLTTSVGMPSGDLLTSNNIPSGTRYLKYSALKTENAKVEIISYGLMAKINSLQTELSNAQKQISTLNKQFVYDKNGRPYRLGVVDGKITALSATYKEVVILGNSLTWHEYWGGKGTNDAENWSGLNRSMSSTTDDVSWPFLLQRILQKREPTAKVAGVMMRNWEGQKDGERDVTTIPTTKALLDGALTPTTDLIIFRTGENSASGNAALYKEDVLRLIDYCLAKSPNASVLICGLFWPNTIKDEGIIAAAGERGYQYISAGRLYSDHREIYGDYHIDSKTKEEVLMSHLTLTHTNDLGFYLWANNVADNLGYGAELLNELHEISITSSLPKGYKIKEVQSPYKSLVTVLTFESVQPTIAVTSKNGLSIPINVHDITSKNIGGVTYAFTFLMPNDDVTIALS